MVPSDWQEVFKSISGLKNRKMFQEKFIVNAEGGISHSGFSFHHSHPLNIATHYIDEKEI